MNIDINKFIALRDALQNEQAVLEARLKVIAQALGQSSPATPAPTPATTGKRVVSEATRAKMKAAQQARHAKVAVAKTPTPAADSKQKRKMSAATKAKLSASTKARWDKIRAQRAVTQPAAMTVPAPKKRKLSKAGRAAIIAGTKARWEKIRTEKAAQSKK